MNDSPGDKDLIRGQLSQKFEMPPNDTIFNNRRCMSICKPQGCIVVLGLDWHRDKGSVIRQHAPRFLGFPTYAHSDSDQAVRTGAYIASMNDVGPT